MRVRLHTHGELSPHVAVGWSPIFGLGKSIQKEGGRPERVGNWIESQREEKRPAEEAKNVGSDQRDMKEGSKRSERKGRRNPRGLRRPHRNPYTRPPVDCEEWFAVRMWRTVSQEAEESRDRGRRR